jgi:hypothetical protein
LGYGKYIIFFSICPEKEVAPDAMRGFDKKYITAIISGENSFEGCKIMGERAGRAVAAVLILAHVAAAAPAYQFDQARDAGANCW